MPPDDPTLIALQDDGQIDDALSNEIKLFSDGILDTLKRQLEKYLTGALSVPTPALLKATENAPLNNIPSERTLGMVDAHLKRAPNAQIDLISAKVKCAKNRTMQWLGSHTTEMQRKIIRSAVRQRRGVMLERNRRKVQIMHTLNQRLYEVVQKQETKKTKDTEKVVSTLVAKGENLSTDDIEQEYPSIDSEIADRVMEICRQPDSIKGHDLSHLWFDKDKCQWDLYCGSICDLKKTTKKKQKQTITICTYTIEYWLPGCPEDSHKSLLTLTQLATDLILGDLVFT